MIEVAEMDVPAGGDHVGFVDAEADGGGEAEADEAGAGDEQEHPAGWGQPGGLLGCNGRHL